MDTTTLIYLAASFAIGYAVKHVQAVNAGKAKPFLDPTNQHSYDEVLRALILKVFGPGGVPVVPTVPAVPVVPAPAAPVVPLDELLKALLAKLSEKPAA